MFGRYSVKAKDSQCRGKLKVVPLPMTSRDIELRGKDSGLCPDEGNEVIYL